MDDNRPADNSARPAMKSPEAFRTISEAAIELDVPQHVLRFWESRFPQVKPLKRGGGRRYYRPEDIGLLKRIRAMLYDEGYTIKGVQKILIAGLDRLDRKGRREAATPAPPPTVSAPPPIVAPAPPPTVLPPAKKAELAAVLRELVELKKLLDLPAP
ncbi:MAG: MerR family transcriptional regulator [Alphaproteobacteria bacterium]